MQLLTPRLGAAALVLLGACHGAAAPEPQDAGVPQPSAPSDGFIVDRSPVTPSTVPDAVPDGVPDTSPTPACAQADPGYTDEQVMALVQRDAAGMSAEARGQTLYVTLGHLAEGKSACDMNFFRFGIGQLANMTSWASSIYAPQFIDDRAYVARIDVRALQWDPLARQYLLTTSKRADYGVLSAAEDQPAVVRGDWLAAQLTRPPVYGYVLRNQLTERQMEAQAGVDNSQPGQFAGVHQSIVALNPRILERRESQYGSCWISHDFRYRTQATAVMESGELPPDDLRFALQQYIAREYICSLPNGMQSYQLTGFVSQRRWDGNTCVAQNKQRADKLVLNGQCFNCHADGLIRVQDEVRGGNPHATDYTKAHFPEQSELDALFDQDQARYMAALSEIPYYDASYTTPLNDMIATYSARSGDDLREAPGGTFGAFLPGGVSGGPAWDDVINPLAALAVDVGILLPAQFVYQDIPEQVIPAFEQKYRELGINPDESCH